MALPGSWRPGAVESPGSTAPRGPRSPTSIGAVEGGPAGLALEGGRVTLRDPTDVLAASDLKSEYHVGGTRDPVLIAIGERCCYGGAEPPGAVGPRAAPALSLIDGPG